MNNRNESEQKKFARSRRDSTRTRISGVPMIKPKKKKINKKSFNKGGRPPSAKT